MRITLPATLCLVLTIILCPADPNPAAGERGGRGNAKADAGLVSAAGALFDLAVATSGSVAGAKTDAEVVDMLFLAIGDMESLAIERASVPLTAGERKKYGAVIHENCREKEFPGKVSRPNPRRDGTLIAAWNKLKLQRRDASLTLHVVDTPDINAFTHVGGYIYVHRGLINLLQNNEDAIAFVLAHEAAHVRTRDTDMVLAVSKGTGAYAPIFADSTLPGVIARALATGYGKKRELAADRLGMELATEAGYSRVKILNAMAAFAVIQDERRAPAKLDGRIVYRLERHFSTHPDWLEREEALNPNR